MDDDDILELCLKDEQEDDFSKVSDEAYLKLAHKTSCTSAKAPAHYGDH